MNPQAQPGMNSTMDMQKEASFIAAEVELAQNPKTADALAKFIEQRMLVQYEEHKKKIEVLQEKMEEEMLKKQASIFQKLQITEISSTYRSVLPLLPTNECMSHSSMAGCSERRCHTHEAVDVTLAYGNTETNISPISLRGGEPFDGSSTTDPHCDSAKTACQQEARVHEISEAASDAGTNVFSQKGSTSHDSQFASDFSMSANSFTGDTECRRISASSYVSSAAVTANCVTTPSVASLRDSGGADGEDDEELLSQSVHIPLSSSGCECYGVTTDSETWVDSHTLPVSLPAHLAYAVAFLPNSGQQHVGEPTTRLNTAAFAARDLPLGSLSVGQQLQIPTPEKRCIASETRCSIDSSLVTLQQQHPGVQQQLRDPWRPAYLHPASLPWLQAQPESSISRTELDAGVIEEDTGAAPAVSALRTPDDEDDLRTSLRLSLRQKHARQLVDLRAYYEEEMENLRCQLSSTEYIVMQEPYKKLLFENERLLRRNQLLDDELTRTNRYILSVDRQMATLENSIKVISKESHQTSYYESYELSEQMRAAYELLQKKHEAMTLERNAVQCDLKSLQEALQLSRKEMEQLQIALAQLKAEKEAFEGERVMVCHKLKEKLNADRASCEDVDVKAQRKEGHAACGRRSDSVATSSPVLPVDRSFRSVIGTSPSTSSKMAAGYQDSTLHARHQDGTFRAGYHDGTSRTGHQDGTFRTGHQDGTFRAGHQDGTFRAGHQDGTFRSGHQDGTLHAGDQNGSLRKSPMQEKSRKERNVKSVSRPHSTGCCLPNSFLGDHSDAEGGVLLLSPVLNVDQEVKRQSVTASDSVAHALRPSRCNGGSNEASAAAGKDDADPKAQTGGPSSSTSDDLVLSSSSERENNSGATGGTGDAGKGFASRSISGHWTNDPHRDVSLAAVAVPEMSAILSTPPGWHPNSHHAGKSIAQRPSPADLLCVYSPTMPAAAGRHSTSRSNCTGEVARNKPADNALGINRFSGGDPGALTSERLFGFYQVAATSTSDTSWPSPTDKRLPAPVAGNGSPSMATSVDRKSSGDGKRVKATQTRAGLEPRKQPARRTSPRRCLNASFSAAANAAAGDRTLSQPDTAMDRVSRWADSVASSSAGTSSPLSPVTSGPGKATATTAECARLVRDLEMRLDELLSEKRELEAVLSRVPASGASLQERLRQEDVERQLDCIDRDLGSVRIALRRYKAL